MVHPEFRHPQLDPSGRQTLARCGQQVAPILNLSLRTGDVLPHVVTCWPRPVWAFVLVAGPSGVLA